MTKKEIREKLCALCLYAPYGVKVKHDLQEFPCELQSVDLYRGSVECVPIGEKAFLGTQHFHVEFVKPILRTMDSMTNAEADEWQKIRPKSEYIDYCNGTLRCALNYENIQWLCERKFDFMGLIRDGMAVDEQDIF